MNLNIDVVAYDCLVQNILDIWFNLLAMVRIVSVQWTLSIQLYCRYDLQEKRPKTLQGKKMTASCQIIFRQWG